MKILFTVCFCVCIGLLQGCASRSDLTRDISHYDNFILASTRFDDTYASLAQEFLGDRTYASVIKRYNPDLPELSYVAIPVGAANSSAVYTSGYQHIPILCYHQFTTQSRTTNRMVVTATEFKQQMQYLYDHGYQVVTLDALYRFIQGHQELPDKAVVITIDDGYRSYLDIAVPILKRYQFPSTMFIYPDFIGAGLALTWRELRSFSHDPLIDIQSHSKSHDSLSPKPSGEEAKAYKQRLEKEVLQAQKILDDRADHKTTHFAYPYGNTSKTLIELLDYHQYRLGLTVERGSNPTFSHPLLVNRTMIYGGDSISKFARALNTFKKMDLK